jgi:hypothetical protein
MTIQRAVSVMLAVVAVAMLATSTLGYTSASVDRGVQVNVVEAGDAYVNVTVCETPQANASGNGGDPVKVTVTNQHADSFTVESITWSDDAHPTDTGMEPGDTLAPGSSVTYDNAFGTDEVTVVVSGGLDAAVTVDVEPCDSGNSNASSGSSTGSNAAS